MDKHSLLDGYAKVRRNIVAVLSRNSKEFEKLSDRLGDHFREWPTKFKTELWRTVRVGSRASMGACAKGHMSIDPRDLKMVKK